MYSLAIQRGRFKVDLLPELPLNKMEELKKALHVLRKLRTRYVLVICKPTKNLVWIMEKVLEKRARGRGERRRKGKREGRKEKEGEEEGGFSWT